jgi:hypothetical protein
MGSGSISAGTFLREPAERKMGSGSIFAGKFLRESLGRVRENRT